jgi:hypothetical protein
MRVTYSSDRKFTQGQIVSFAPGAIDGDAPGGTYTILACLPDDGIGYQYKVKSALDSHERVVRESRLTSAERSAGPIVGR